MSYFRIDIIPKISDARALVQKKEFGRFSFAPKIQDIHILDSYTLSRKVTASDIQKISQALVQSSVEKVFELKDCNFDWIIEIGFLPGVTDNVGTTARETIEDTLGKKFKSGEHVFYTRSLLMTGKLSLEEVVSLSEGLYNPLIQMARIFSITDIRKTKGIPAYIPEVHLATKEKKVIEVSLDVSEEKLEILGKKGIQNSDGTYRGPLALDLLSLKAIQDYFKKEKRNPTDIEIESIAQTWSEHCKHTIFANPIDELKDGLYKTYIQKATKDIRKKKGKDDFCVSVFTDNAGGISFDEKHIITHKVETHNSPSALDPFGGAITGIVGVNRDAMGFGLGSKPVANVFGFCFGEPNDTRALYKDKGLTQKMLSPLRILEGVVRGVNVGGNCSGIPTVQGFAYFHDRFRGKPLVFVGTLGLIPKKIGKRKSWEKEAKAGDYIVMAGGRVGLDGIHGATFSSTVLDSGSPATAVQIGDPITQKKMSDAIVKEARDKNLFSSITDNGAGGISCSVAEMARECGGCVVNLDKVPVKYPGLVPWQIWISESQERMTLAVPKGKWKEFKKLMDKRGVEATIIGEFKKQKRCKVLMGKKVIMDLDMEFLHKGLPKKQLNTQKPVSIFKNPKTEITDFNQLFKNMLSRSNMASHAFINRQYDHEVQAGSVMKPFIGEGQIDADTAIFRPVLSSKKGAAVSSALYPFYSEIDPYHMAGAGIDTSIRNLVVTGVDPKKIALLDNFCWCDSNNPERLWQLKEAVRGCYDYALKYEAPFISGKDSMFNDFHGYDAKGNKVDVSVPPTLLISSLGLISDVRKTISPDFKFAGDHIYVLGETKDECGGSEFYEFLSIKQGEEYKGTKVPVVDAEKNIKTYHKLFECIQKDLIVSAKSVNQGGMGMALLKASIAGNKGINIQLAGFKGLDIPTILFSESQGRIIVSVSSENKKSFEAIMKGIPQTYLGTVMDTKKIEIKDETGKSVTSLSLADAQKYYKEPFQNF